MPGLQAHKPAVAQDDSKKWAAAVSLQPVITKPGSLLGCSTPLTGLRQHRPQSDKVAAKAAIAENTWAPTCPARSIHSRSRADTEIAAGTTARRPNCAIARASVHRSDRRDRRRHPHQTVADPADTLAQLACAVRIRLAPALAPLIEQSLCHVQQMRHVDHSQRGSAPFDPLRASKTVSVWSIATLPSHWVDNN